MPQGVTVENAQAFHRARRNAFGRDRITELERVAVLLGLDSDEGRLVMDAADQLAIFRQAIHGGSLERPSRHWNKR